MLGTSEQVVRCPWSVVSGQWSVVSGIVLPAFLPSATVWPQFGRRVNSDVLGRGRRCNPIVINLFGKIWNTFAPPNWVTLLANSGDTLINHKAR